MRPVCIILLYTCNVISNRAYIYVINSGGMCYAQSAFDETEAGNTNMAKEKMKNAKNCTIAAVIFGVVGWIVIIVTYVNFTKKYGN